MPVVDSTANQAVHDRAVTALRESYAAIPPGAPVRLAKRTSNLFRFRSRQPGPAWTSAGSTACWPSTRRPAPPTCRA